MARSDGWIISPAQDLAWFWGGAGLSLAAGLLAVWRPSLALPLFCAWLLMGDGPHFWATWTRSVWDPSERARRWRLIAGSFAIWAPGFAAWGVAALTGNDTPWLAYLGFAALWGYHHGVRQDYGIWSLYARRAGATEGERKVDAAFLYASLWGLFAAFTAWHPVNRAQLGMPVPAWVGEGIGAGVAALVVGYAGVLGARVLRGRPVRPGLFALVPCALAQAAGFAVVGSVEPLVPGWGNLEQAFAVLAFANGIAHGVQYLGLVGWAAKQRYPEGGRSFAGWLSARPMRAWAVYVALSVPYLGLNLLRNAAPGVTLAGPSLERLALCVYWGFVLHHYLLDQYVWRPSRDTALRADLGLA